MKKIVAFLLIAAFSFSSCEKDDICDANTPTTPRLVIEFYDINNPTVLKNVTDLKVIGEGMTEGIIFNNATDDERYLTSGTSIAIPLKTDSDATTYSFILNSGNANPALIDTDKITFNYTKKDVYISRACGFKIVFDFINDANKIVQTAVPDTKPKWMQNIQVQKNNIDNENETHIKVFF